MAEELKMLNQIFTVYCCDIPSN